MYVDHLKPEKMKRFMPNAFFSEIEIWNCQLCRRAFFGI